MINWKKTAAVTAGIIVLAGIGLAIVVFRIDYNRFKPDIVNAVKAATGRNLSLAGDIRLNIGLRPALAVERVSFENADWGSRPELATIARLEAELLLLPLLKKEIVLTRFVLIEPDILVETDQNGNTNLDFAVTDGKPNPPAMAPSEKRRSSPAESLPAIRLRKVDIQNGRITYRNGKTGQTRTLAVENFSSVQSLEEDRMKLTLAGAYDHHSFKLSGTAGRLGNLPDPTIEWPVDLVLEAAEGTAAVQGSFTNLKNPKNLKGNLALHLTVPSLPRLGTAAKLQGLPDIGPVTADAHMEIMDAVTYRWTKVKTLYGESDLKGTATLRLSGERPRVSAELTSSKLDLRPFEASPSRPVSEPEKPEKIAARKRVFSSKPLPLDGLNHIDADIRLRFDHILSKKADFTDFSTHIRLDGGRLGMKPIQASAGGTGLTGAIDIDTARKIPAFACRMTVKHLDFGRMVEAMGIRGAIAGRGDMNAGLTSRGRSVAEVMGGLNGAVSFAFQNGFIQRRYIDLLSFDVTSGLVEQLLSIAGSSAAEQIDIQCLFGHLDIKNGVVDVSPFVVHTPQTIILGTGDIHLKTERLDLSVSTEPANKGRIIKFSLGKLARIFKLTGTLAHPALGIDPVESSLFLAKAFGGKSLAGTTMAIEALLGNKDVRENPCLRMVASPDEDASAPKKAEKRKDALKRTIEETGKAILDLFNKP